MILSLLAVLAVTTPADEPDGVIATARADAAVVHAAFDAAPPLTAAAPTAQDAAPHGLTTDQQIDQWLAARRSGGRGEGAPMFDEALSDAREARRVHGEAFAEIGTNGHRAYGGWVTAPLGENGFVSLSFSQSEGRAYGRRHHLPDSAPIMPDAALAARPDRDR